MKALLIAVAALAMSVSPAAADPYVTPLPADHGSPGAG